MHEFLFFFYERFGLLFPEVGPPLRFSKLWLSLESDIERSSMSDSSERQALDNRCGDRVPEGQYTCASRSGGDNRDGRPGSRRINTPERPGDPTVKNNNFLCVCLAEQRIITTFAPYFKIMSNLLI
jgi:hypothetical protein